MRFVIAPGWFMDLPDDKLLCTKQVLYLYGYSAGSKSIRRFIETKLIPRPDKVKVIKRINRLYWSVRYLRNYLKLPTELNELNK